MGFPKRNVNLTFNISKRYSRHLDQDFYELLLLELQCLTNYEVK